MKRIAASFLFLFFVCGFGASSAFAAVTLRSVSEVDRATVRLSDVFMGLPENKDKEIAIAPAPGKNVSYEITVLTRLAQQYQVEWQPQTLSDRCLIKRASVRISAVELESAVIQKIKEQLGPNGAAHFDVVFDSKSPDIHLPTNQTNTFVLNNFSYDSLGRRFHADFVAGARDNPVVMPLAGRVSVKHEVPVLARRLEVGTVLAASDLIYTLVPSEQVSSDMVTDQAQLIGRELRRDIAEGTPLRSRDIMPQRLVTRGSLVTMKIETPYMRVTAQGRAMQDGGIGETVRLTNTQSKRVIEGIVVASGVVRIPVPSDIVQASAEALR